jgi:hypothetical protein
VHYFIMYLAVSLVCTVHASWAFEFVGRLTEETRSVLNPVQLTVFWALIVLIGLFPIMYAALAVVTPVRWLIELPDELWWFVVHTAYRRKLRRCAEAITMMEQSVGDAEAYGRASSRLSKSLAAWPRQETLNRWLKEPL